MTKYAGPNKNPGIDIDGRHFYTAQVVDAYERTFYDQTVIFEDFDDDDKSPTVVDYYYGEPNEADTEYYVRQWIGKGN